MTDFLETSESPEKLDLTTPDGVARNIDKLAELFPGCVTETRDPATGELRRGVDFDTLRQELSDHVVEGGNERYRLDWPGKRAATLAANAPIDKTLRPCRDESVNFDTTRNLFIEGDNLEALKLLQETYLGMVKMIFIDPPYNTGKEFIYDDDFAEDADTYLKRSGQRTEDGAGLVANPESKGRYHSDWLSMMWPRLKLARNLLRDDGVIFIAIDDHEVANLRRLCGEVFGEQNFVATVIWQKVYSPKNSASWFSEDHDYVLCVAKSKPDWFPRSLPRTEEMEARYRNPDNDSRGPWKAVDLSARNRYDAGIYPISCPSGRQIVGPPTGRYWGVSKQKFDELNSDDRIWWGASGDNAPAIKRFLSEVSSGRVPQTLWKYEEVGHTQDAKQALLKYVSFDNTENVLNSVKPIQLIQRCLHLAGPIDESAIVVDFFSGSASTAHAMLSQNAEDGGNRRFIAVQIDEPLPKPESGLGTIFEMGTTRVRNVIKELETDSGSNSESEHALGFRVLKIDSSCFKDIRHRPDNVAQTSLLDTVDHVKEDRTGEDLLFQVLLDWGVDLGLPIATEDVSGHQTFFVDTDALAACFDTDLDETYVKTLAARKPLRVVFRDGAFGGDAGQINVVQLFRQLSPDTEVKVL